MCDTSYPDSFTAENGGISASEAHDLLTAARLTESGRDYMIGWLLSSAPDQVRRALDAMHWYEDSVRNKPSTFFPYFKRDDED